MGEVGASENLGSMSVYRTTEVIGTSPDSFAEATRLAVEQLARSVPSVSWFEVASQRGTVVEGKVTEYQVRLVVGFRLEGE